MRPRTAGRGRVGQALPTMAVAAAVAGFWVYFHAARPGTAFHTVNADPEVPYFLASLAVFKGQPYAFVEHPGTPLELIGTALLAPARPFYGGGQEFVRAALRHPGVFMVAAHALLGLATLACVLRLGRRLLSWRARFDGVQGAAVAASFFAVLPSAFTWPAYWSHNAAAFPLGTALLAGAWAATRRAAPLALRSAFLLGLGAGTLAAIQLYLAVWVIGLASLPLWSAGVAQRGWRDAFRASLVSVAGAALAFAVWTLPILPAYPRFLNFVAGVVTHQGIYGSGPAGFSSWRGWMANLRGLASSAPLLFVALGGAAALLAGALVRDRGWRRRPALWAMAGAVTVQAVVLLILLGKHPSTFYLPALAALLPLLLAMAFAVWREGRGRVACTAVSVVVLGAFALNLARDVRAHQRRLHFRTEMEHEVDAHRGRWASERGGARPLLLWGPGLPDAPCYALWMGEQYTGRALAAEISSVCPDEGLAWSGSVALPRGRGDEPALLVTTERTAAAFPAFRALGTPELSPVRDPAGNRLAFHRVAVQDGRVLQLASTPAAP